MATQSVLSRSGHWLLVFAICGGVQSGYFTYFFLPFVAEGAMATFFLLRSGRRLLQYLVFAICGGVGNGYFFFAVDWVMATSSTCF